MRADKAKARLREIASQPDTVMFIGSGVSAWSGLPTWRELISELADFLELRGFSAHLVRRELEHADLLQAASFGFDVLTPQDAASFLRQACRYGVASPSALHRSIATLGPTAFITTNYDKLLEQALATERPENTFRVVNNVNQVETASIIQSRARDFVFKPHGDIDASDSIILTREQYRALQHERRFAFEAFKTLMASRPVLFVGFGLRDPDFLLIKDTLAAIYLGAAQDHYAIAPDIGDREADYWRNNYGIHLVSYEQDQKATHPEQRHRALLELVEDIATTDRGLRSQPRAAKHGDSATLAVLRHARRMAQLGPPADMEILPLAASPHARQDARAPSWETQRPFIEGNAVRGLQRNSTKLLLTGPPGAGKTFVVRAAVAGLAQEVIEGLGREDCVPAVPTYIDLRDYTGNLWEMVVESFPVGFPLDELIEQGRVSFFVDGLNEVSARIVEDNTLSSDLQELLDRVRSCSVVMVTRFSEEHMDLELPEIALESIPREYVFGKLEAHGVPKASISEALLTLLERPVFYRFCVELELWDSGTPHTIYTALLLEIQNRSRKRFGNLNLMSLFGQIAFDAIDSGDLLIPINALARQLKESQAAKSPDAVIDWLLTEAILIPRQQEKVTFFHHSFTEYLAAYELAARFVADPSELTQILRGRRWDQAVLLSLGFLEKGGQREFFTALIEADAALGLRALGFVEQDWEQWTSEALGHLGHLDLPWSEMLDLAHILRSTRISPEHERCLLRLARGDDAIAGVAMAKTLEFGGEARVRRVIDSLFDGPADFNRCSAIGDGLRETIDLSGIRYLIARLAELKPDGETVQQLDEGEEADAVLGLVSAAAAALGSVGLEILRDEAAPHLDKPLVQTAVLDLLWDDKTDAAIELTAALLTLNAPQASVALHFQLSYRDDRPDLSSLRPEKHGPILLEVEELRQDGWAIDTLRLLASYADDWLRWTRGAAEKQAGDLMEAMLWCAAHQDDRFFASLERLCESGPDWSAEPLGALSTISDFSWQGHEDLFMRLLRERNDQLAYNLIESADVWANRSSFNHLIGPEDVTWWVDWLAEPRDNGFFVEDRLGSFIAGAATPDAVAVLTRLFADDSTRTRQVLAFHVLGKVAGLQLSQLPDEGIEWAVDNLGTSEAMLHDVERSVLAKVATEDFVEEVLLPRLKAAKDPFRSNLLTVIRQAGERHRRRYVTTSGEVLG